MAAAIEDYALVGDLQTAALAWREWLLRAVAGDPGKAADHVRGGRRAPLPEHIPPLAVRLRGFRPGADRQRCRRPAPTGCLGGGARHPAPGPRHRAAWVAADRAADTVRRHGLTGPINHWRALRGRIHAEVCASGCDAERNTFTQFYGSRGLDAALLLLPRVGFLPWQNPRIHGTVDAVARELCEDGLLLRYHPGSDGGVDALPGTEGAFLACTFWLADALHGIGRRGEARALFEHLLTLSNGVGLLSEQYDPQARRHLGNTPQAFSLVGLVNTARFLSGTPTRTTRPGTDQRPRTDPSHPQPDRQ